MLCNPEEREKYNNNRTAATGEQKKCIFTQPDGSEVK